MYWRPGDLQHAGRGSLTGTRWLYRISRTNKCLLEIYDDGTNYFTPSSANLTKFDRVYPFPVEAKN